MSSNVDGVKLTGRDSDQIPRDTPLNTPTTQGLSLWCFNIVGGEILTIPDTPTTQGLSLWCFMHIVSYGVWAIGGMGHWACSRARDAEDDTQAHRTHTRRHTALGGADDSGQVCTCHIRSSQCTSQPGGAAQGGPSANAREATFSSHRPCSDLDLAHPAVPILLLAELDGHERFA